MAPQFVDVSSYQGAIDWVAYRTWAAQWDGVARVAMKATEGVGFTDTQFEAYRTGALAAGIDTILYYHFARPDLGNSATDEANWCHNVVGNIRSSDQIVLDIEKSGNQGTNAQWAYSWLQTTQQLTGRIPVLYSPIFYIQGQLQYAPLAAYPLWLADWTFDPNARPAAPAPWAAYEAIQYTDTATNIPGIGGNVDCNVFIGGQSVNQYGPNSADFATWFTVDANGNWVGKSYNNPAIMGENLKLYSQLSIDGNTLPLIGLPRTNELYQTDSDGYKWSVQFFERGVIVYDPQFKKDSEPGVGTSYIGKYLQFLNLDPAYQPIVETKIPDALATYMKTLPSLDDQMHNAWQEIITKLLQTAGLPIQ